MRYQDYVATIEEHEAKETAERDANVPKARARAALFEQGMRFYDLGADWSLSVHGTSLRYGYGVDLRGNSHGQVQLLTAAVLAKATQAVGHVEAWVAGLVDELAPSGPWPLPGEAQPAPVGGLVGLPRAELIAEVRAYIADGNDPAGDLADLLERHLKTWGAP